MCLLRRPSRGARVYRYRYRLQKVVPVYFCRLYFLLLPPDFGFSHCCQGRSLTTLAFLTHCLTHDDANGCNADEDEVHVEMMRHVERMTRYQTWMQQRASSSSTESPRKSEHQRNGTRANKGVGGEMELKKEVSQHLFNTGQPGGSDKGTTFPKKKKNTRFCSNVISHLGVQQWVPYCTYGYH